MAKAKPIVKEQPPFELKNAEYAKKVVFQLQHAIKFEATIQCIKGCITVRPDGYGGAELKCQVWLIWSKMAKTIIVPCADEEDFEYAFDEARRKTIAKMEEMLKQQKKKKLK